MPTELKPCPFCGGDPVEFRYSGSPCVGCKDCIAYLGGEESDLTYAQLAEAWNLRADQQTVAQLQARVAELEAAVFDLHFTACNDDDHDINSKTASALLALYHKVRRNA